MARLKAVLTVYLATAVAAYLAFLVTGGNYVWALVTAFVVYKAGYFIVRLQHGDHIEGQRYVRGTRLVPSFQARLAASEALRKSGEPGFQWGRIRLPINLARQHGMIAGTTRSGKTVLARLFMQSVFPNIGKPGAPFKSRALVYDGKAELLKVLYGMQQPYQAVHVLNPFHPRSSRWDIARDVRDDASANQMAAILFPSVDHEMQPFFSNAVRLIAGGLMKVFIERATRPWNLGDLIYTMGNSDRIRFALNTTARGRDTLEEVFRQGETLDSVISTIATKIQDYEIIAGLMDHAGGTVSLEEWVRGEAILVLQQHHRARVAVDALNRAMFQRASELLISQDDQAPSTWVVLDEVATAGKLDGLDDFMDKGGSKGVCVVLSFQNVSGLKHIYGEHKTNQLTALCSSKAFLRFEDKETASWAASYFGDQEVVYYGHGYSRAKQEVVTHSELLDLSTPAGHPNKDVVGYFVAPVGAHPLFFRDALPGSWLFNGRTLAPEAEIPTAERPDYQQKLIRTPEDLEALLLSPREIAMRRLSEEAEREREKQEQGKKAEEDRIKQEEQERAKRERAKQAEQDGAERAAGKSATGNGATRNGATGTGAGNASGNGAEPESDGADPPQDDPAPGRAKKGRSTKGRGSTFQTNEDLYS